MNEIDKDFVDVINQIEFGSISNDISKKKILFKPKGNLRKLSSSIPENSSTKINFYNHHLQYSEENHHFLHQLE